MYLFSKKKKKKKKKEVNIVLSESIVVLENIKILLRPCRILYLCLDSSV